jgi:predicted N-acyltransferase
VATAVISAFTVSLDIFLGKAAQRLVARVRRWFPRCLRIDVLFCGLPASFGQSNLLIADDAPAQPVLESLAAEMESIASETGLRFLCVKEFKPHELARVDGLQRLGFFRGYSIPYMTLDVRWRSFDEYLRALRHSYRRHIRRSLAKMAGPDAHLVAGGPEVVSPARFHQLYCNVMARSETRLEMLNEVFFERLWAELGRDLQVLAVVAGGEVLGAALLFKSAATLNFMLVGLPEAARTPYDVYFNLLYAIVDQAIRQGCRRVNLAQTAYWGKQQIGGEAEEEFLFFKAKNRFLHAVLRALRRILFPRLRLRSPRVFR